ncbi:MAG: HAD-IA family hydrolase, partial [Patescibacteria group bacterium]
IEFFKSKNHKEIPNSSLIPVNDPTVLFTTAGMHPIVPFLSGQKHPLGKRLVNVQRCIRTGDIEEVGDTTHHTFFEMLGNWSLGDYFKEEAIQFSFEFLTKILKIPKERLAITCFGGDKRIPELPIDTESAKIWESMGMPKERIAFLEGGVFESKKNWWGPAGETGPCGPDTEMFYWRSSDPTPKKFNPEDKRWVEIWNDVFMQYKKDKKVILIDGMNCLYDENFKINKGLLEIINHFNSQSILVVNNFREKGYNLVKETNWKAFSLEEKKIKKDNPEYFKLLLKEFNIIPEEVIYFDHKKENIESAKSIGINSILYKDNKQIKEFIENNLWGHISLKQKNVDTGMGVERTLAILNNKEDNYQTEIFLPIIQEIENISHKKYKGNEKAMRIIADHIKASVFMIGDETPTYPSNVGQGYVLRRIIRRAIRYGKLLNMEINFTSKIAERVLEIYQDYKEIQKNKSIILTKLDEEENKFKTTIEKGIRQFEKLANENKNISGEQAFLLFQSYGFPIEMTEEMAKEKSIKVDVKGFYEAYNKHQELSRTTSAGTFKSGLADHSEKTTRLHTATHLLNEAMTQVLGPEVAQRGSNITPERTRFDFVFSRKLTDEEIKKIESIVNKAIDKALEMKKEDLPLEQAFKSGAKGEFGHKYPEKVSVFTAIDKSDKRGYFSREICTGPHVKNTKEVGHVKIISQESVSAGIRRIKAIVQ